jgi:hypothetical protein
MKKNKHDWEIVAHDFRCDVIIVDAKCTKCGALQYLTVDLDNPSASCWQRWHPKSGDTHFDTIEEEEECTVSSRKVVV